MVWFGRKLFETEEEVQCLFDIHYQNVNYFPMQVLHKVLLARHGSKPAGHWVVMQATIARVELIAVAYAWSQKGVAYMISSCGKKVMHEEPYLSCYKDNFGNVQAKELLTQPLPTCSMSSSS